MNKYFAGRLGRLDYANAFLATLLSFSLLSGIVIATINMGGTGTISGLHVGILIAPLFWLILLPSTVKRFHDLGYSGWWLILVLLLLFTGWGILVYVITLLYLFFQKGVSGINKYGDQPEKVGGFFRPLFSTKY
jgi:uncharacterized membrane protein YhaH (DUF805 family)